MFDVYLLTGRCSFINLSSKGQRTGPPHSNLIWNLHCPSWSLVCCIIQTIPNCMVRHLTFHLYKIPTKCRISICIPFKNAILPFCWSNCIFTSKSVVDCIDSSWQTLKSALSQRGVQSVPIDCTWKTSTATNSNQSTNTNTNTNHFTNDDTNVAERGAVSSNRLQLR